MGKPCLKMYQALIITGSAPDLQSPLVTNKNDGNHAFSSEDEESVIEEDVQHIADNVIEGQETGLHPNQFRAPAVSPNKQGLNKYPAGNLVVLSTAVKPSGSQHQQLIGPFKSSGASALQPSPKKQNVGTYHPGYPHALLIMRADSRPPIPSVGTINAACAGSAPDLQSPLVTNKNNGNHAFSSEDEESVEEDVQNIVDNVIEGQETGLHPNQFRAPAVSPNKQGLNKYPSAGNLVVLSTAVKPSGSQQQLIGSFKSSGPPALQPSTKKHNVGTYHPGYPHALLIMRADSRPPIPSVGTINAACAGQTNTATSNPCGLPTANTPAVSVLPTCATPIPTHPASLLTAKAPPTCAQPTAKATCAPPAQAPTTYAPITCATLATTSATPATITAPAPADCKACLTSSDLLLFFETLGNLLNTKLAEIMQLINSIIVSPPFNGNDAAPADLQNPPSVTDKNENNSLRSEQEDSVEENEQNIVDNTSKSRGPSAAQPASKQRSFGTRPSGGIPGHPHLGLLRDELGSPSASINGAACGQTTAAPNTCAPPTAAPMSCAPPVTEALPTCAPPVTEALPTCAPPAVTEALPTCAPPAVTEALPTCAPPVTEALPTCAPPAVTETLPTCAPPSQAPPVCVQPAEAPTTLPPPTEAPIITCVPPPTEAPTAPPTQAPPTCAPPIIEAPTTTCAPPPTVPPTAPPTPPPITQAPTACAPPPTQAPITCAPPPTEAPTTLAPPTAPPTQAPITCAPPPTEAPTTLAPPTAPPTQAPITCAPPTQPPTTCAPPTQAPTTCAPPPTEAPTTCTPPTQPPTTCAPATQALTCAPPTSDTATDACEASAKESMCMMRKNEAAQHIQSICSQRKAMEAQACAARAKAQITEVRSVDTIRVTSRVLDRSPVADEGPKPTVSPRCGVRCISFARENVIN
ncbi:unnamed protein product [Notodromas monacha]|uniref:Uncharacterized protein n=1 Tax=Notodromas monacha TaxID=399045 RepID=A0A7R9GCV1_9CRUS|nr:unnamed protein product [Notodromas monacha]CAG0918052.1 unnamed protein product [Notodromas monacha]